MPTPTTPAFNGFRPIASLSRLQHAVGQGGFHSARLTGPSDAHWIADDGQVYCDVDPTTISWIYDCGSETQSAVHKEVDTYLDTAKPWLDLLFISHLDADHVNGVERLFSGDPALQVGTIALPYLEDGARAYALAQAIATGDDAGDGTFIRDLIVDPVDVLSRFAPRRILLFRSGSDVPEDGFDGDINTRGPSGPDSDRPCWKLVGPDRAPPVGKAILATADVEATVVSDHAILVAPIEHGGFEWIFKPYVRPAQPLTIDKFLDQAAKNLNLDLASAKARLFDTAQLKMLLSDEQAAKALGDAYKTVFKSKNQTSLCVYAGPAAEPGRIDAWAFCFDNHNYVRRETIGWLGTGDLNIKPKIWVDRFLAHYAAEIDRTRVLQIPHHGSILNWNVDILDLKPRSCVVSAAPLNPNWKHPSPIIVSQVKASGVEVRHVTYAKSYQEGFIFDAF